MNPWDMTKLLALTKITSVADDSCCSRVFEKRLFDGHFDDRRTQAHHGRVDLAEMFQLRDDVKGGNGREHSKRR